MTDLAIKKVDGLLSNAGLGPLEVVENMVARDGVEPFSRWTAMKCFVYRVLEMPKVLNLPFDSTWTVHGALVRARVAAVILACALLVGAFSSHGHQESAGQTRRNIADGDGT
jgi:hypothetical protein